MKKIYVVLHSYCEAGCSDRFDTVKAFEKAEDASEYVDKLLKTINFEENEELCAEEDYWFEEVNF